MKESNEYVSKGEIFPKRKPVRKIRPDLFVETSKRLKKFISKDNRYFNINNLLSDPYYLIACYETIKSGNKGIDNNTLDDINDQ